MENPRESELKAFDDWLRQKRSLSDNTRTEYVRRLDRFLSAVLAENKDQPITEKLVLDYLDSLGTQNKFSDKTINCYRDAISAYIKFRDIDIEPPPIKKLVQRIPDIIDLDDKQYFENKLVPLIEVIFDKPEKVKAVFYLMHDTGLRPSSIEALRRSDFDLNKRRGVCLNKKSKREMFFVFTKEASYAMQVYFAVESEETNAFNVTRSAINKMCNKLQKHFKDINIRPYLFRHTVATKLLQGGASDLYIADFLGHSSTASLKAYAKTDINKFQKVYDDIMEKR